MILVLVWPLVTLLAEPVLGVPHRVPAVLLVGGSVHGAVLPVVLHPAPPGLVPSLLRVHLAPDLSTMLDEVRKSHYFEFLRQLLKVETTCGKVSSGGNSVWLLSSHSHSSSF